MGAGRRGAATADWSWTDALCYVVSSASTYTKSLCDVLLSVIRVNYDVVTLIIKYSIELFDVLCKLFLGFISVMSNICSSALDFITEICHFLYSFVIVIWKLGVLLMNVLDLIFRAVEFTVYFLFSGGKWTADALKISFTEIQSNASNLVSFLSKSTQEVFSVTSGALTIVGSLTLNVLTGTYNTILFILASIWSGIDSLLLGIAEGIQFITDSVYYFLVYYLPTLSRETYFGVITLTFIYILIANIFKHLSRRGLTFPFLAHMRLRNENMYDENGMVFEFSDDDFEVSDDELNRNDSDSEDSIETDEEDDDSDDDIEFEVDDSDSDTLDRHSSDESDATSTNTIDIQLPTSPADGRYNLRRSATPNITKIDNSDDMEREIEREREKQKCVVCQDNTKSVLILPCRHMCLCVDCGNQIARARNVARRICPLCRRKIRTIMDVYV